MGFKINKKTVNIPMVTIPKSLITPSTPKAPNTSFGTKGKTPAIGKAISTAMVTSIGSMGAFKNFAAAFGGTSYANVVNTSPTIERDFENIALEGLDKQRPDLISLINFIPAYKAGDAVSSTAIADLIAIQTNLRIIAEEIIEEIVTKLVEVDGLTEEVLMLQNDFLSQLTNARDIVRTINTSLELFDRFKKSLNIKRFALARPKNSKVLHIKPGSVKRSLIEDHGFNPDNFPRFSTTKVIMQLFYELYQVTNFYSHTMLSTQTSDRFEDSDAIELHKPVKINIERLMKLGQGGLFLPTYVRVVNGLPEDLGDRIKLLVNFLANETTVSQAMGMPARLDAINKDFRIPVRSGRLDNPFLAVIGVPGDNIYNPLVGIGPAASVPHIVQGDTLILPVETKYIVDENEESEYISGEQHLIKSIYAEPEFNTTNIDEFQTRLTKINKMATSVRRLMSLGSFDLVEKVHTDLNPELLSSKGIAGLNQTPTGVRFYESMLDLVENTLKNDLTSRTTIALLNFSTGRSSVRNLLYKYFAPSFDSDGILQLQTTYNTEDLGEDDLFDPGTTTYFVFDNVKESLLDQILNHVYVSGTRKRGTSIPELVQGDVGPTPSNSTRQSVKTLLENVSGNNVLQAFYGLFNGFRDTLTTERNAVDPDTKKTRWREFTEESLFMLIWELYVSMINRLTTINITNQGSNSFAISGSQALLAKIPRMVQDIKKSSSFKPPGGLSKSDRVRYRNIVNTMIDVRLKMRRERAIIDRTTQLLDDWANDVKSKGGKISTFFGNLETESSYGKFMKQVSAQTDTGAGISLFDRQQVVLANKTLDDIVRKVELRTVFKPTPPKLSRTQPPRARARAGRLGRAAASASSPAFRRLLSPAAQSAVQGSGLGKAQSGFGVSTATTSVASTSGGRAVNSVESYVFDGTIPSKFMQDALQSMLKSSRFRLNDPRSSEIKLLTVGIPIGFQDHLREKIDLSKLTEDSFTVKETDLIRLQIMKQDLEYDSIIFKPIEYLFELSRFVPATQDPSTHTDGSPDPSLDASSSFEAFLDNVRTEDYAGGERFGGPARGSNSTLAQVKSKSKDKLASDEMSSELYQSILQPGERDEIRRNHITSYLLEQYVRFVIGIDFRESSFLLESVTKAPDPNAGVTSGMQTLLDAIDADDDVRAYINLFTTKTILSDGAAEFAKILTPKRYERVFNIPVLPDEFEIDETKTKDTPAGIEQFNLLQETGVISQETVNNEAVLFLRRRNRDNIALERFFVVIATHDDEGFV